MEKAKREPGYVLPHNPLTAAGVLDEIKQLKGNKTWLQWELELLTAQYPDNTTFKAALEQYRAKAAAATTQPTTPATEQADKETPAPNTTTGEATKKQAGKKDKK
jgi:hypothetical protein